MTTETPPAAAHAPTATPAPAPPPAAPARPAADNPAKRIVKVAVLALLGVFAYTVIADRLTPYTAQATLNVPLAQIAPEISGEVVAVEVKDNAAVRKGDVLFRIDREPVEIAVRTAEANLAVAIQGADVSELDVRSAEADLAKQRIDLKTTDDLGRIVLDLARQNAVSETTAIRARSSMDLGRADSVRLQLELERARANLGEAGADNAKVKQAQAAVDQARLDLRNTQVVAPGNGVITNLRLTPGQFVNRGAPVLTFIEDGNRWLVAAMRENQLGNISPGDEVGVTFDDMPGHVFSGRVHSVGWGVAQGGETPTGQLPDLQAPNGWLREPQRFPVRIVLDPVTDKDDPQPPERSGAQANVVVYCREHSIFNPPARIWLRVVSLVSYLR